MQKPALVPSCLYQQPARKALSSRGQNPAEQCCPGGKAGLLSRNMSSPADDSAGREDLSEFLPRWAVLGTTSHCRS